MSVFFFRRTSFLYYSQCLTATGTNVEILKSSPAATECAATGKKQIDTKQTVTGGKFTLTEVFG